MKPCRGYAQSVRLAVAMIHKVLRAERSLQFAIVDLARERRNILFQGALDTCRQTGFERLVVYASGSPLRPIPAFEPVKWSHRCRFNRTPPRVTALEIGVLG